MCEGGGYQETLQELQNPGLHIFLDKDFKNVRQTSIFLLYLAINCLGITNQPEWVDL
jgi:hypothetical protein